MLWILHNHRCDTQHYKIYTQTDPKTNVDCLGHNVITGCGLDISENSFFLGEMLDKLGLSKRESTLMTDGAAAYPEVAELRVMKHLLCIHHFQVGCPIWFNNTFVILLRKKKIPAAVDWVILANEFRSSAMSLIYHDFHDADAFLSKCEMIFGFIQKKSEKAVSYIQSIIDNKSKVCKTFTGLLF